MYETIDSTALIEFNLLVLLLVGAMAWLGRSDRTSHRIVFGALAALLLLRYVQWRLADTLPDASHGAASAWAYSFLVFELTAIGYTLFSIVVLTRRRDGSAMADRGEARLRAAGRAVPAVDVFIATYNEDLAVLEKTIIAAKAIDYPHVNVWVLDDTRRDWLRDYCATQGVHYARRPDNSHAKAGNLNNGLRQSAASTNAPYILVLDADFAPQRNILYRILGLFDEPGVGLVQTPQFYYNADPIQHNLRATDSWVDEQRVFFDVFQPAKDAWNAAFCVGTSFVIARQAITEAGGFPTGSVCEDIHTSYLLRQRGLLTRWLNERLSVGLSAEGLIEYINQRSRWCLGTMQVALLKDGPLRGKGYRLSDRLHYLHGMLHWLSKPFIIMMLVGPVLYWFGGIAAFYASPSAFLMYGLPALVGFWGYGSWITARRTLPIFTEVTQIVASFAVTMTIASAMIRPFGRPFKVTAKGLDRSKVIVHWKLAGFFMLLVVLLQLGAINTMLTANLDAGMAFNLGWTLVALVLNLAAIMACIDLPRLKQEERFPFALAARWEDAGGMHAGKLIDLSLSGAALAHADGEPPPIGSRTRLELPRVGWIEASVVRHTPNRWCVHFAEQAGIRQRLIELIFSDAPHNIAVQAHPGRALSRFLRLAGWASQPRSWQGEH